MKAFLFASLALLFSLTHAVRGQRPPSLVNVAQQPQSWSIQEGFPLQLFYTVPPVYTGTSSPFTRQTVSTATLTATSFGGANYDVPAGKKAELTGAVVSCDRPCQFTGTVVGGGYVNGISHAGQTFYFSGQAGPNKDARFDFPANVIHELGRVSLAIKSVDPGQEYPNINYSLFGREYPAFYDASARSEIRVIGDSRSWSQMGNDPNGVFYSGSLLFGNQIATKVNTEPGANKLCNAIVSGFGGSNSQNWAGAVRAGRIKAMRYDVLLVLCGINDAVTGGISTASYAANMATIIDDRDANHQGKTIIFIGTGPTGRTDRSNLADFNTALANLVSTRGGASANLYFYDPAASGPYQLALSGTPTTDVNFTEKAAGSATTGNLHWSGAGHTLVANGIWNAYKSVIISALR